MLRIYDEFLEDETIGNLKDRSYRLHVSALIYCARNLTDGELSARSVKVLQVILGFPVKRYVADLVESELWLPKVGGGYVIRNYLEFNPKSETVKKERSGSRDRMRKLRERRAAEGSSDVTDERDGVSDGVSDGAVPNQSLPVQSSKDKSKGFSPEQPSDFTYPNLREIA